MMLLGDSHLTQGRFDEVLRRLWQSRLGNGGPGWIQPTSVNLNVARLAGVEDAVDGRLEVFKHLVSRVRSNEEGFDRPWWSGVLQLHRS